MATFERDNAAYERWLRKRCDVVEDALRAKHERMRESEFGFLRATFFRWARTIETICPSLTNAPRVLAVGDIHIENFGIWRDAEARLVWGINDFDEAAEMPYAYDLVRLATSALLAPTLAVDPDEAAAAILEGYARGLTKPRPTLLDERAAWLRALAIPGSKVYDKFWHDVDDYPDATPPGAVRRALQRSLPPGSDVIRYATRTKGGGSLGRPRYLVIARWQGGRLLREAKALVPSAWDWARRTARPESRVLDVARGTFRSCEPAFSVKAGHVIRRVAPDARKLDLEDGGQEGPSAKLLAAMGADLGAVHAADKRRSHVLDDLGDRCPDWLFEAARASRRTVQADFMAVTRARHAGQRREANDG